MVADFICAATRTWDDDALNQNLLPLDTKSICQIRISHVTQDDFWAWHYEKSGSFSVRSAYRLLVDTKSRREGWLNGESGASDTDLQDQNWKNLWRIKVPPKLRLFAWRLARSSLPTGEEKKRRHIIQSAVCPICNVASDSWRHALLDCNMAKSVWALRDDDLVIPLIGDETPNARLWLFGLCKTLKQDQMMAALVTLWAVWWARRKAIHEEEFQSPLSTHLFIERYLDEIRASNPKSTKMTAWGNTSTSTWIPLEPGFAKFNIDGAVAKSSNRGAVGVVCRDELGVFLVLAL